MYKTRDYLDRGYRLLHNGLFPRRRKISTLMIYATDLCDSACQHCLIWKKRPVKYLPMESIIGLMNNRCITRKTQVGLEGGEFLLHPDSRKIMGWFHQNHPHFDLLSNCLKPDSLIEAVRATPPSRLFISLDGTRETYQAMRGKDGYDRVLKVIQSLHKTLPISVMFCVSPWNTMEDLKHVAGVCKSFGVDLRVGVYSNIQFFDTQSKAYEPDHFEAVPEALKAFSENYDYLLLYNQWRTGKLKLTCKSIFDSLVVLPNGDVPICMNLDVTLGNIFERTLDEIVADKGNLGTLRDHRDHCNGCWINFHRKYDIILARQLERFFPKGLVGKMFGYYQWAEHAGERYHEVVARLDQENLASLRKISRP